MLGADNSRTRCVTSTEGAAILKTAVRGPDQLDRLQAGRGTSPPARMRQGVGVSSAGSVPPSGSSSGKKPKESRRWLKPRVPKEQLYRLSPRRPKPKRLGRLERWDRIRRVIRTWWIWLAVAIVAHLTGHWIWTLIAGAWSFFFYHTTPESHPAVYALETDLNVESAEFPITMAGMTGMPLGARQSGRSVQQRRRIFPGDAGGGGIGRALGHHGAVHFLGRARGAAFRRGLRRKGPQRNSGKAAAGRRGLFDAGRTGPQDSGGGRMPARLVPADPLVHA